MSTVESYYISATVDEPYGQISYIMSYTSVVSHRSSSSTSRSSVSSGAGSRGSTRTSAMSDQGARLIGSVPEANYFYSRTHRRGVGLSSRPSYPDSQYSSRSSSSSSSSSGGGRHYGYADDRFSEASSSQGTLTPSDSISQVDMRRPRTRSEGSSKTSSSVAQKALVPYRAASEVSSVWSGGSAISEQSGGVGADGKPFYCPNNNMWLVVRRPDSAGSGRR